MMVDRSRRDAQLRRSAGFTLLELLVSLAILGTILVGFSGGIHLISGAVRRQTSLIQGVGEVDAVLRGLRGLIESMDPGGGTPFLLAEPHRLSFITVLPAGAGSAGRVEVVLGLDGTGRLLLRWTPHRHVRPFGPSPEPQQTELLRGVVALDFGYWDAVAGAWRTDFPPDRLPALVRVRTAVHSGGARTEFDVVAAPRREPPL